MAKLAEDIDSALKAVLQQYVEDVAQMMKVFESNLAKNFDSCQVELPY